jgi:hypothetical protein
MASEKFLSGMYNCKTINNHQPLRKEFAIDRNILQEELNIVFPTTEDTLLIACSCHIYYILM